MKISSKNNSIIPSVVRILYFTNHELSKWQKLISQAESEFLTNQGLASIKEKKFHCQGGAIFSAYKYEFDETVARFIIAFQTISDYLDNLCDRSSTYSSEAFASLHQAMHEVFFDYQNSEHNSGNYYLHYHWNKDGGYLQHLVGVCRKQIQNMPYAELLKYDMGFFTKLYTELQVFKHLHPSIRVEKLHDWTDIYIHNSNISSRVAGLKWWEFACAAGSTLSIFTLLPMAQGKISLKEKQNILDCYFPWICSLHILLDYLIDQEEDQYEGDLNFVSYYNDREETLERLSYITEKAYKKARSLSESKFHTTVISGLLAIYLSDQKVETQNLQLIRQRLLNIGGNDAFQLFRLCKVFRKFSFDN